MAGRERLLDPTGDSERAADTTLAPRLSSLRGLTVGLLDNTKPNAATLLADVASELKRAHGLRASVLYTKSYFGTPAEESLIQRILHNCDFAVAGIGDWGSCSAASLADGVLLERAGVPAVSICTDAFVVPAQAMAKAYGFPGFEFVTVPHPVASLDEAHIQARVRDLVPGLLRILGVESPGLEAWVEPLADAPLADAPLADAPLADAPLADAPLADGEEIRRAMEYYDAMGWTDGLPVVPVTESYLAGFLTQTSRDPDETVFAMPHLNRRCTVRLAAINAAMAGCRPEYFPVVLAAWESLAAEGYMGRGIWQSTTGTAPLLVVNGPVRERLGMNSAGNVFGSGFRANATIGRAIRLTAINAFGLRPHQLDQATQGTPAKYTACIAENEEQSPWPPLHADFGLDPADSAVTSMIIRSCVHIEARHTTVPEQLALDITGTIARTGALIHETASALIVLSPEHAHLFARAGWGKAELSRFVYEHAVHTRAELAAVGKDAVSSKTRWRLPAGHPEARPDQAQAEGHADAVPALNSPGAVLVVVAGANNAGVSAVVETFGPRGGPPAVVRIPAQASGETTAEGT